MPARRVSAVCFRVCSRVGREDEGRRPAAGRGRQYSQPNGARKRARRPAAAAPAVFIKRVGARVRATSLPSLAATVCRWRRCPARRRPAVGGFIVVAHKSLGGSRCAEGWTGVALGEDRCQVTPAVVESKRGEGLLPGAGAGSQCGAAALVGWCSRRLGGAFGGSFGQAEERRGAYWGGLLPTCLCVCRYISEGTHACSRCAHSCIIGSGGARGRSQPTLRRVAHTTQLVEPSHARSPQRVTRALSHHQCRLLYWFGSVQPGVVAEAAARVTVAARRRGVF